MDSPVWCGNPPAHPIVNGSTLQAHLRVCGSEGIILSPRRGVRFCPTTFGGSGSCTRSVAGFIPAGLILAEALATGGNRGTGVAMRLHKEVDEKVSVCPVHRCPTCPNSPAQATPHPPLNSTHLRATASSHPRGNPPKVTVPSPPPPPREHKRTHDTKQGLQTRGHMNQKKTQKLPVGKHVQLY